MCQKQHGAAVATYVSIPRSDLKYVCGEELLTSYPSPEKIIRKFCSICGSNIEWSGSAHFPDWASLPLAALDTPFIPHDVKDIHLQSRACWLQNCGALTRFMPATRRQLHESFRRVNSGSPPACQHPAAPPREPGFPLPPALLHWGTPAAWVRCRSVPHSRSSRPEGPAELRVYAEP